MKSVGYGWLFRGVVNRRRNENTDGTIELSNLSGSLVVAKH